MSPLKESGNWAFVPEPLDGARRYELWSDGQPVSQGEFLAGLKGEHACREAFLRTLRADPAPAYRVEFPVFDTAASSAVEFVVIDEPRLLVPASAEDFAEHLDTHQHAVVFPNLGRDARLVVPVPHDAADYAHLAAFLRTASDAAGHALWRTVAETMETRLCEGACWLSTSGLAVPWLHVRIDSRPKYFTHSPYCARPEQ